MKIEDKRISQAPIKFSQVCVGQTFFFSNHLFIKTDNVNARGVNAIQLEKGYQDCINDTNNVLLCNAKIVIED
jgi:hypothetical protein